MARQPRFLASGVLYHVVARGNHRQPTFLADPDYHAYLLRLATYRKRYGVNVYAYCLMPNHVHLLLETSGEPLSKFMQGVQQSYTQRFNRVHGTVGHLFQARYKAIVCDKDEYFVTLARYIHLNPVRAGLVERPEAYPYSGHRAYLEHDGLALVDVGPILRMLGGRKEYRRFVLAGLGAGHDDSYYQTEEQQFLGSRPTAQRAGHTAQSTGLPPPQPLDPVLDELARGIRVDPAMLRGANRTHSVSRARAIVAFVLVRRFGYRVTDVAVALARDSTSVSAMLLRLAMRLESDARLAAEVEELSETVRMQGLTPSGAQSAISARPAKMIAAPAIRERG
jgi:REP element-mobilizing transposase RayT